MELNISEQMPLLLVHKIINASKTDCRYLLLSTGLENVLLTYIYPIIMMLGVSGNMCFLMMMARFRQMRSTINYYLTSLAIADLMILIIAGIEMLIPYYTIGKYPLLPHGLNRFYCSFMFIIIDALYFTSLFHITLVTVEIFYALCKPLVHRRISSNRRTFGLIFLSWFVGIIFGLVNNLPLGVEIMYFCIIWPEKSPHIQNYPMIAGDCVVSNHDYALIRIIICCVGVLVSLVVNCALYILIIYRLKKRQTNKIRQTSKGHLRAVCKMITINGIAFFLCVSPWCVCFLLLSLLNYDTFISISDQQLDILYWSAQTSLYINSMINPFIYGTFNARYRAALRSVLTCKIKE